MRVAVSSSHISSATASFSGGGHIPLFPSSSMGTLPWEAVLEVHVSASHRLQFFMNCFSLGPFHGTQSFRNKLFQCGSPAGSQVLPTNLLQSRVVFRRQQMDIDSLWTSLGCRETACLTFTTGCRGTFALTSGVPPPLPFPLALVSAKLFLSHILTSLSGCNCTS